MSSGRSTKAREVSINPQTWRWSHPRVLVEDPDKEAGLAIASGLRFAGYAVAVCPGPRGHGQCPLTVPEGCAPAHETDLVVCSLGYEREVAREALRELRTCYPKPPFVVEVPSEIDAELRDLLDGCSQLPGPASPEQIVAAVQSMPGHLATEAPPGA